MVDWIYPISTALVLGAVAVTLPHAIKSRDNLEFYILALIYGFLLEKAAIIFFHRYSYPVDEYLIHLFGIPIGIPLAWAVFIYSGYISAKHLGLPKQVIPPFVGLFVLHIDFAIDAIAIRVPFWIWDPAGLWFGVPIGNFFAWYMVGIIYTGTYLWASGRFKDFYSKAGTTVVTSSIILLIALELWEILESISILIGIALLILLILGSVGITWFNLPHSHSNVEFPYHTFMAVVIFHIFYIFIVVSWGIYKQYPILLVVAISMLLFELVLHIEPEIRTWTRG